MKDLLDDSLSYFGDKTAEIAVQLFERKVSSGGT